MYIFLKVKCSTRFIMKTIRLLLPSCSLLSPPFQKQVLGIVLTLSSSVYVHISKWHYNADISCIFSFGFYLLTFYYERWGFSSLTPLLTHTHTDTDINHSCILALPHYYCHAQLSHFTFLIQTFGSLRINNYLVLPFA